MPTTSSRPDASGPVADSPKLNLLAPPTATWTVVEHLAVALSGRTATKGDGSATDRPGADLVLLSDAVEVPDVADAGAPERSDPSQAWTRAIAALDELAEIDSGLGLSGDRVLATFEPPTTPGSVTTLPWGGAMVHRVHLVVRGTSDADLRTAGAAVGRTTRGGPGVVNVTGALTETGQAAYVEGFTLGQWAPPRWTKGGVRAGAVPAGRVVLVGSHDEEAIGRALVRARATQLGRNLAATPSNTKNPAWMVTRARSVARRSGLEVKVWTDKQLAAEGFGGLLAVGGGSATPPRLVQLEYTPDGANRASVPHVVLVGKGITFDSGGLQIKPADGMATMKTDMSGSAVVLAVLGALRDLDVRVRVTGLLALAENAVSGSSYRPGDVVTQYGGTTVEIGNTDAEGRIVLADALAYADTHLDPDIIVDIATLTGAARVALARVMAPVYATDESLTKDLVKAGETTGETLWPLPLAEVYRRALDSDVADLKHIADGVGGGSVVAALFLREFVGERRWAHLDIAGPGRSDVDAGTLGKGGTAFGTRLLLRWLEGLS